MNALTKLTIMNLGIRRDAHGRYCLNDCHKASGGDAAKRPGEWLRNNQTMDLIDEIETAGITAIRSQPGRHGGTYVVKELVYAYAMWISPKFHLQVIRAFDAMVVGHVAQAAPKALPGTYVEALKALIDAEEAKSQLQAVVEEHIEHLTVAEFIALSHRYASHGEKVRIGQKASALARSRGSEPVKSPRTVRDNWGNAKEVFVNTYPRALLEETTASSFMTQHQSHAALEAA